jgi:hypothetical protein
MRPASRLPLLAALLSAAVLVVLGTGVAWLRRAPVLPPALQAIAPGMTLGEIERLVGHPLTRQMSCTGRDYFVSVPCEWSAGQELGLVISTTHRGEDPRTGQPFLLAHDQERCRRVTREHWSRLAVVNRHEWLYRLVFAGG